MRWKARAAPPWRNAGRTVLALELLGVHMLRARIRETGRPIVTAEIERLQKCAAGAFTAHDEAEETLSLTG